MDVLARSGSDSPDAKITTVLRRTVELSEKIRARISECQQNVFFLFNCLGRTAVGGERCPKADIGEVHLELPSFGDSADPCVRSAPWCQEKDVNSVLRQY